MVFQNITFKHTNSGTDSGIHAAVSQKLATLQKYISEDTEARAEVEFEKIASHRSGLICRVEVNVWVGGVLYRAEATKESFAAAVDVARGDLDQEMRKAHKRKHSLLRRGGRKIKEMLRFGS